MTRYIRSTKADCIRMATAAHRRKRIALGRDPDVAEDGTPYIPIQSGELVEGRTGSGVGPGNEGSPTGRWLWVPEDDTDVEQADESKEVQERDLGDEFRNRTSRESAVLGPKDDRKT